MTATNQALPKFALPRQSGLTLTAAVGESSLYRPSGDFGGGTLPVTLLMIVTVRLRPVSFCTQVVCFEERI